MKRGRKPKPEVSPEIAAYQRLTDDGASSNATIRKRIAVVDSCSRGWFARCNALADRPRCNGSSAGAAD